MKSQIIIETDILKSYLDDLQYNAPKQVVQALQESPAIKQNILAVESLNEAIEKSTGLNAPDIKSHFNTANTAIPDLSAESIPVLTPRMT